jgi:hypothetical protein
MVRPFDLELGVVLSALKQAPQNFAFLKLISAFIPTAAPT